MKRKIKNSIPVAGSIADNQTDGFFIELNSIQDWHTQDRFEA